MALDAQARRALRSIQRVLSSSVPTPMLQDAGRNDADAWGALAMLELRMLLARGQTHQARQFADRVIAAADAGLPVAAPDRQELQQLISAIDSVQASRHFLAVHQLQLACHATSAVVGWAARMWLSRSLAAEGQLVHARQTAEAAASLADELGSDAALWAACFASVVQARAGEDDAAELRMLQVVSQFVGRGETRGVSFSHLALARIATLREAIRDSEAAAELAYETDGSWTGPVVWLARIALAKDNVARARELLRSIPNPTADAFNLTCALELIESRYLPLQPVLIDLAQTDAPPGAATVETLEGVLERYPDFWPARATLAWKVLSLDRPDDARRQLEAMNESSADGQAIAALRYGLQVYEELHGDAVDIDLDEFDEPSTFAGQEEHEEQTVSGFEPDTDNATAELPVQEYTTREVELPQTSKRRGLGLKPRQSGMAGQLSLFGVPDLLQFFSASRRSGDISFSSHRGDAKIRLHDGSLYWAVSPQTPELGAFLCEKGAITSTQLEALEANSEDEALSQLLDQQQVEADQLQEPLREIIHRTLKELVDWSDGWFLFDPAHQPSEPPPQLLFNAQGVLLDVLREIDEENR